MALKSLYFLDDSDVYNDLPEELSPEALLAQEAMNAEIDKLERDLLASQERYDQEIARQYLSDDECREYWQVVDIEEHHQNEIILDLPNPEKEERLYKEITSRLAKNKDRYKGGYGPRNLESMIRQCKNGTQKHDFSLQDLELLRRLAVYFYTTDWEEDSDEMRTQRSIMWRMYGCKTKHMKPDAYSNGADNKLGHLFSCKHHKNSNGVPACPHCYVDRKHEIRASFIRAITLTDNDIYVSKIDSITETTAILKSMDLKSLDYRRFPNQDGTVTIISTVPLDNSSHTITLESVDETDWDYVAKLAPNSNISGSLGTEIKKPKRELSESATTTAISFNMVHVDESVPEPLVNKCYYQSVLETADMNPQTANEVRDCINKRVKLFVSLLNSAGIANNNIMLTRTHMNMVIDPENPLDWPTKVQEFLEVYKDKAGG